MANVNVKFNNKNYLLSCDDGQEENLKELAMHLDSKYNELKKNLGNIGESKLLLITAIQIIDDYFALNKKINSKKNEFEKLSIKFKELKSELEKIDKEVSYKFGNRDNFNQKIDELNQETETLIDEIDKWQM